MSGTAFLLMCFLEVGCHRHTSKLLAGPLLNPDSSPAKPQNSTDIEQSRPMIVELGDTFCLTLKSIGRLHPPIKASAG